MKKSYMNSIGINLFIRKEKKIILYILAAILLVFALKFLENNQQQHPDCTSPYLSGATNWSLGEGWKVNLPEMEYFKTLSAEDRIHYRFTATDKTESYAYNAIGLMYMDAFSRTIFFWQGDLQSLISLQQLIHILLSFWILLLIKSSRQKILFYFLYAVNPLIVYLVDFPYYYFWQVIPTAVLLIYILRNKKIGNMAFSIAIIFSVIFIMRPSTLFISLFVLGYIGYKESKLKALISIVLFLGLSFLMKPDSVNQPWHTMYVGVGAYSNEYNIELKDESGYEKFEREIGQKTTGGCKKDALYEEYVSSFIKKKYFDIIEESPFLLMKNALLNILESYGFGYKPNLMVINYFSAFIGLVLMLLLLYFGEYILFFAIGISSASFTLYYPPIAAYLFGSYILIVYAWIVIIIRIWDSKGFSRNK